MNALSSSKFEFKIFLFKRRCSFKLHCSYNVVQITFRVLHEKTLQSKERQRYIFHTVISLWRWVISFEYIKLSKNNFFSFSKPFWKVRIYRTLVISRIYQKETEMKDGRGGPLQLALVEIIFNILGWVIIIFSAEI